MNTTTRPLNIRAIRLDGGTQARVKIDSEVVQEYAAALADGVTLPPISVMYDRTEYWLVDGFHRLHAHISEGRASITATVSVGTSRDAVLLSLSANIAHGLRLSNADKRKAVQTLLDDAEWSTWSDRQIAKTCGVSPPLVGQMRSGRISTQHVASAAEGCKYLQTENTHKTSNDMPGENIDTTGGMKRFTPPPENQSAVAETTRQVAAVVPTASDSPTADVETLSPEELAEAAFGDQSILELLEETEAECVKLRELLAAAEQDDQKAETLKWRRIADVAQRRQNELMETINQRENDLKRANAIVREVCKAMGTDDPRKVVGLVRAMVASSPAP